MPPQIIDIWIARSVLFIESLYVYLCFGSVVIEASEGSEVLLGDGRGKMGADHGIGVGWIADHHNLRPEQCMSSSAQTLNLNF